MQSAAFLALWSLTLAVAPRPALAQDPPELWTLSLRASGSWDDNVNLEFGGNSGVTNRYGASLRYVRNTPRSQLSVEGSGTANQYIDQPGGDRLGYSGTLGWTRSLSPRTSLSVSDSLASSFTQAAPILAESGLVFPYTQTLTNAFQAGLDHDFSERHGVSFGARHHHVVFRESQLVGGDQAELDASYRRRLGPSTRGGLTYSFRLDDFDTALATAHSLSIFWTRRVGLNTDFRLSAGASAAPGRFEDEAVRFQPVFGASVTHQTERNAFSLAYRRRVDQAFGFGRQRVGDVVNTSWSRSLGRIWNVQFNGGYGRSRDPSDPDFGYDSQYLGWSVGVRPVRSFSIGADGRAVRRQPSGGQAETSLGAGVNVSYSWEWR